MSETLEQELARVVRSIRVGSDTRWEGEGARTRAERNQQIVMDYYGFATGEGMSMEAAGKAHCYASGANHDEQRCLTRESVRQIVNRFVSLVERERPDMPVLDRCLAEARALIPISEQALIQRLRDKGLAADRASLEMLARAEEVFCRNSSVCERVQSHGGARFILSGEDVELVEDTSAKARESRSKERTVFDWVIKQANKRVSRDGAVHVPDIAEMVEQDDFFLKRFDRAEKEAFLRDVFSAHSEFYKISEDWFYKNGFGRNCVLRRLSKIFSVMESAHIDRVMEGLDRSMERGRYWLDLDLPEDEEKRQAFEARLRSIGGQRYRRKPTKEEVKRNGMKKAKEIAKQDDQWYVYDDPDLESFPIAEYLGDPEKRTFTPGAVLPPRSVIIGMIEQDAHFSIDEQSIVRATSRWSSKGKLRQYERDLVRMIFESEEGMLKEKELEDRISAMEANKERRDRNTEKYSFSMAISRSPLLSKQYEVDARGRFVRGPSSPKPVCQRGEYTLVGTPYPDELQSKWPNSH